MSLCLCVWVLSACGVCGVCVGVCQLCVCVVSVCECVCVRVCVCE